MGIFDRLKGVFLKEEEKEEQIPSSDVASWLEQNTASVIEDINHCIKKTYEEIESEKSELKEKIVQLKNAKLKNENIPERAKQIMQGNRVIYIKLVSDFNERLNLPDHSIEKALEFFSDFENNLNSFNKSSSKSYYVLQEFFANESASIARTIKEIDKKIRQLYDRIKKSNIILIHDVKKNIEEIHHRINLLSNIKKEIIKEETLHRELGKQKGDIENKIKEIKNSPDFIALEKLKSEKEEFMLKLEELEDSLAQDFSILDRALRKYKRITLEENLLNNYLNGPIETLLRDTNLKIVELMGKVELSIKEGHIKLKEKKGEKTISVIGKLNREYLKNFVAEHNELKENIDKINKKISANSALSQIRDLTYKKNHITHKLKRINNRIDALKTKKNKIDIDSMKEQLQKDISKITKIKVTII